MQHIAYPALSTRTPLSSKAKPFVSSKVILDEPLPRSRSESPEPEPSPASSGEGKTKLSLDLAIPAEEPELSPVSSGEGKTTLSLDLAIPLAEPEPWLVGSIDGKPKLDLSTLTPPPGLVELSTITPPPGLGLPNGEQQGSSGSEPECEQSSEDSSEEPDGELEMQHARDIAAAGGGLSGHITVMVRYIPSKYSQNKLMNEINRAGFEGTYDFFYVPLDNRNYGNRGFAFINFLSAQLAEEFYNKYHGKKFKHFEKEVTRDIAVMPADVQGFEESAKRFYTAGLRKKKNQGEPVFLKPVKIDVKEKAPHLSDSHSATQKMEAPYVSPMMASPPGLPPSTLAPRFCGTCGSLRVVGHAFCQYCGNPYL